MTLVHSNWTLCSPWNLFLQEEFPLLYQATCSIPFPRMQRERALHNGSQNWMRARALWTCFIQVGPGKVHKTYFWKIYSHFIRSHMQHFPFPACREKGIPQCTPKLIDFKGCMTLGNSIWTMWGLPNFFLDNIFPFYNKSHTAFPFSRMQSEGIPNVLWMCPDSRFQSCWHVISNLKHLPRSPEPWGCSN